MTEFDPLRFLRDPALGLVKSARPGQLAMAAHVAWVAAAPADEVRIAAVQARTGTGKTFAALVPALLSTAKRIVYSTAGKRLQAQLMETDLPRVTSVVVDRPYAKRVGKGNHLCRLRLGEAREHGTLARYDAELVERFEYWADVAGGELADFGEAVPFDFLVRVTECLKHQCPVRRDCPYLASVEEARDAEVLVVNHALLAYDLMTGGGKMLGKYDLLVVDEAHKLVEACRDAHTLKWHPSQARNLEYGVRAADLEFPMELHGVYGDIGRELGSEREGAYAPGRDMLDHVDALAEHLEDIKDAFQRAGLWAEPGDEDTGSAGELDATAARQRARAASTALQVGRLLKLTKVLAAPPGCQYDAATGQPLGPATEGIEYLTYTRAAGEALELCVTPVDVGPLIAPALRTIGRVVLTSATLGDLDYALAEYGLRPSEVVTADVPSPFDYTRCSALYVDRTAPLKPDVYKLGRDAREAALVAWYADLGARLHELLEASRGGAFVLCSSREDLDGIGKALEAHACAAYTVGVQARTDDGMVEWFKADKSRVLLGLKALREGVDVPGLGLRMVVELRLPFPNARDPLLAARKERRARRYRREGVAEKDVGYRTFLDFEVNMVALDIDQGFGRLIRTSTDLGIGVCLDPRLVTKPYSRRLLSAIPLPLNNDGKAAILRVVRAFAAKAFR